MRARGVVLLAACGAPAARPPAAPAPRVSIPPGDGAIAVDGGSLAYHVAGRGRPCVAWPGGPGLDAGYLRSPELERHATVIYVDPMGTGRSSRLADPGAHGKRRSAADLERLRQALGLERLCLIGHSYGGLVALTYALQHPERVERLLLYAATARVDAGFTGAARAALAARRPGALAAAPPTTDDEATALSRRIAPLYLVRAEQSGVVERLRAHAAPMTAPERAPLDLRGELGTISAPTLVVAGRHDPVCGPRFAEELASGIRGARLTVLEGSGHLAHLEEPAAFERAVAGFLE